MRSRNRGRNNPGVVLPTLIPLLVSSAKWHSIIDTYIELEFYYVIVHKSSYIHTIIMKERAKNELFDRKVIFILTVPQSCSKRSMRLIVLQAVRQSYYQISYNNNYKTCTKLDFNFGCECLIAILISLFLVPRHVCGCHYHPVHTKRGDQPYEMTHSSI